MDFDTVFSALYIWLTVQCIPYILQQIIIIILWYELLSLWNAFSKLRCARYSLSHKSSSIFCRSFEIFHWINSQRCECKRTHTNTIFVRIWKWMPLLLLILQSIQYTEFRKWHKLLHLTMRRMFKVFINMSEWLTQYVFSVQCSGTIFEIRAPKCRIWSHLTFESKHKFQFSIFAAASSHGVLLIDIFRNEFQFQNSNKFAINWTFNLTQWIA